MTFLLIGAGLMGLGVLLGASLTMAIYQRTEDLRERIEEIIGDIVEQDEAIEALSKNQVVIAQGVNTIAHDNSVLSERVSFWVTEKNGENSEPQSQ